MVILISLRFYPSLVRRRRAIDGGFSNGEAKHLSTAPLLTLFRCAWSARIRNFGKFFACGLLTQGMSRWVTLRHEIRWVLDTTFRI